MKKHLLATLLAGLLALPLVAQSGGVPSQLNYQATVRDELGNLIAADAPATYTVSMRIFGALTGGAPLWSENHSTSIFMGRFSIILGSGNPIPVADNPDEPRPALETVFDDPERYVEITLAVSGDESTSRTLSPRQKIVATATALRAKIAESVPDGSITTLALANNAITAAKISSGAVGKSELAANAVEGAAIKDGAILNAKLANNSVTGAKIVDGTITASDLGANSVARSELADNAVGTNEIENLRVTLNKLALSSVDSSKIVDQSIMSIDIGADAVGASELRDNAVDTGALADGSVTSAKLHSSVTNVVFHPAQQIKMLSSVNVAIPGAGVSGDTTKTFDAAGASGFSLPTSGINGIVARVRIINLTPGSSNSVLFADGGGSYPSVQPQFANSVVAWQSAAGIAIATVHIPVTSGGTGKYRIKYRVLTPDGSLTSFREASVSISVIGYY